MPGPGVAGVGPLFMRPIFMGRIWGGRRLETDYGYDLPAGPVGECWGIAAHPQGTTTVAEGPYAGKTLLELWDTRRELFGDLPGDRFPLLVKILDARERLSVQVHPDDAYAFAHEGGSLGKRECWYVLAAQDDGKVVIGQRAHDRAEFAQMVADGRWGELLHVMPAHPGDFFAVDPGVVHAILGGTVVLETQQSSDITYRIYDYDRCEPDGSPRELHRQAALDVIDFDASLPTSGAVRAPEVDGITSLWTNLDFEVLRVRVTHDAPVTLSNPWPFLCMSVVAGSGMIEVGDMRHRLSAGDHFLMPWGSGDLRLAGELTIIASHV